MNCQVGYTITNASNCLIIFEHKIVNNKKKSYCTVCSKCMKTEYIQTHIETGKHQLKFYKNFYTLPVLDDAFIIKNQLHFQNNLDNELFLATIESREKMRNLLFEARDYPEFFKDFKMDLDNYGSIKMQHVLIQGKKIKSLIKPNLQLLRNTLSFEKKVNEAKERLRIIRENHPFNEYFDDDDDEVDDEDEYEEEV